MLLAEVASDEVGVAQTDDVLKSETEQLEGLLTFHPGADEAVGFVTGVDVPLPCPQVVVSHGHAVFLSKASRTS